MNQRLQIKLDLINDEQYSTNRKEIKRIDANYLAHEIQHLLHFDKGFPFTFKEILIRSGKSVRDVVSHLAYSALIIGFFMAIWTKIFFYKKGYNIFETFVLLSYIFVVFFISLLIFLLISKVTGLLIITKVGVFVLQGYFVAAIGQFFGGTEIFELH